MSNWPLSFRIAWVVAWVGALIIGICQVCDAGCPRVFSHHAAVAVQAVPVQSDYYYSVQKQHTPSFLSVQTKQQILQDYAEYEQLIQGMLRIKAQGNAAVSAFNFHCETEGSLDASPGNPAAAGLAATDLPQPVSNSSCVKCHNGSNASGGLDLRDLSVLDCETRMEMIRRVMLPESDPEHMPKGGTLSPQDLGDLIGEASLLPVGKR